MSTQEHQQQQQCCLKSIANRTFTFSIHWKIDNAAVAEDVTILMFVVLCLEKYRPVKREGLAICGTANYHQKLTHGWKSSLLRPMRPYKTGKKRFATKIREAVLDLRRPQSVLTIVIRRVRRALSIPLSWQIALFSPILLAPSVGAIRLDQPAKIHISALSYDYWFKILHAVQTNIPSLLVDPHNKQSSQIPSTSDP